MDKTEITLVGREEEEIVVTNMEYTTIKDGQIVKITDEAPVSSCEANWAWCSVSGNIVTVKAISVNPYEQERRTVMKITSPSNPLLYKEITIIQPSAVL